MLLSLQAVDSDLAGSKNAAIRYEIIRGNYEKKFAIDEVTGVITVREPLNLPAGFQGRQQVQQGEQQELLKSDSGSSARRKRRNNRTGKHDAEFGECFKEF